MRQYIRSGRPTFAIVLSTAALFTLAACGGDTDDTALRRDSALGRDLSLAQAERVPPQLQDEPVPPTPAPEPAAAPAVEPRRAAPRPVPRPSPSLPPTPSPAPPSAPAAMAAPATAAAVPVAGTVEPGTRLAFANGAKVCSNTVAVGDRFVAELSNAVSASNGISIPAGATGTFEVTEAKTARNSNDPTRLMMRLVSVQFGGRTYPVESTVQTAGTERVRSETKGSDTKKVAGGAILGAIAGQVLGKGTKGTVIGAVAGAAAGSAAAAATANYDTCLNRGARIEVMLDAPLTLRPAPVP